MTGTALRRTLTEDAFYPPHPPRKASALYSATHHRLVVVEDQPCVVCGVRNSTLKTDNPDSAKALETHHDLIEWAGAYPDPAPEIDWDKLAADHPELTNLTALAMAFHAHFVTNGQWDGGKLDPAVVTRFVDSPDQLQVICDVHHRGTNRGIHSITAPVWQLQRYERQGYWDFTGGGAVAPKAITTTVTVASTTITTGGTA